MRILGLLVALIPIQACGGPITAEQPNCVVRVDCRHDNGNGEHGSGVLVRSDLVLTCNHVVKDRENDEAVVVFKSGLERKGKVIKTDVVWDLALIQFDSVLLSPARLAANNVQKGDVVIVGGFPHAKTYKETTGRVVRFFAPTRDTPEDIFTLSDRCESGMSGSPAFMDGDLVGIMWGSDRFAHCTDLVQIEEFLNEPIPRQDRTPDNP